MKDRYRSWMFNYRFCCDLMIIFSLITNVSFVTSQVGVGAYGVSPIQLNVSLIIHGEFSANTARNVLQDNACAAK